MNHPHSHFEHQSIEAVFRLAPANAVSATIAGAWWWWSCDMGSPGDWRV